MKKELLKVLKSMESQSIDEKKEKRHPHELESPPKKYKGKRNEKRNTF